MAATKTARTKKNVTPAPEASPSATPSAPVLGEIVTWETNGLKVSVGALRQALADAGLDESLARDLRKRDAFVRAAKKLADQRIIRRVSEDAGSIRFQFTAEYREGDGLGYSRQALLNLDKNTGEITCDDADIRDRAQAAFDDAVDTRTGNDVLHLLLRLFDDSRRAGLDLIPIRSLGGVYFVRSEFTGFLDQVEAFLRAVGSTLNRFPVARGTGVGEASVQQAIESKMELMIGEFAREVEAFDLNTREKTVAAAAERIQLLTVKLESYSAYLEDRKDKLAAALAAGRAALRDKVFSLGEAKKQAAEDEAARAAADRRAKAEADARKLMDSLDGPPPAPAVPEPALEAAPF